MAEKSNEKKKTVCVTGGNGFLASALVKLLLQRGYAVNATVRDPTAEKKIEHLAALKNLGELRIFEADLGVEGSFDDAMNGCDFVFLVASPVMVEAEDPEREIIRPAVEGTMNVMRSCARARTVRKVVMTSSAAAVSANRVRGEGVILDEDTWTDVDFLYDTKPPTWGYLAAKTLAEKAAWKFAEDNNLHVITVNPTLIVGPSLTRELPFSLRMALALVTGEEAPLLGLKIMEKVSGSISLVHVEDVCRAQIHLAESKSASGRYIVSMTDSCLWALAGFLSSRYPQYKIAISLDDTPQRPMIGFSSAKLIKEGFEFKHTKLEELYDITFDMGKAVGLLKQLQGSVDSRV